jgi:hypothetical protein
LRVRSKQLRVFIGRSKRSLAVATIACVIGLGALSAPSEAEAARNESRWFLQNVCLANAAQLMGRTDWPKYEQEAKESRKRLRRNGVPEAHLREMEDFATNVIRSTTTAQNAHKGPDLCIQWYKT